MCACALGWSVETAKLARQHNNAQVIGIGGRMHTEAEMLAIVDAFLTTPWSKAERHQRRIDILDEYERTHLAPPVPGAPSSGCPKGIPCTDWPGCISAASARSPVAVSSPQGRFADGAAAVNGQHLQEGQRLG